MQLSLAECHFVEPSHIGARQTSASQQSVRHRNRSIRPEVTHVTMATTHNTGAGRQNALLALQSYERELKTRRAFLSAFLSAKCEMHLLHSTVLPLL